LPRSSRSIEITVTKEKQRKIISYCLTIKYLYWQAWITSLSVCVCSIFDENTWHMYWFNQVETSIVLNVLWIVWNIEGDLRRILCLFWMEKNMVCQGRI
jgi:hypothetical protein